MSTGGKEGVSPSVVVFSVQASTQVQHIASKFHREVSHAMNGAIVAQRIVIYPIRIPGQHSRLPLR